MSEYDVKERIRDHERNKTLDDVRRLFLLIYEANEGITPDVRDLFLGALEKLR